MTLATRGIGDLSRLPDYAFGPTTVGWWGVVGFMLIEGMGFVLAIGAYYYLLPNEQNWPPQAASPPLFWATVVTVIGLVSEIPNFWIKKRAEALDLRGVRIGLAVMIAFGVAMLVARGFEMHAMNVRWDATAYGSVVWSLLALHTFHLATDSFDSGVLGVLAFTKDVDGRKFSDVADNSFYWHFIVWSWVVLYVVIYWTPRWV